jgi:hypothetical protein
MGLYAGIYFSEGKGVIHCTRYCIAPAGYAVITRPYSTIDLRDPLIDRKLHDFTKLDTEAFRNDDPFGREVATMFAKHCGYPSIGRLQSSLPYFAVEEELGELTIAAYSKDANGGHVPSGFKSKLADVDLATFFGKAIRHQ